MEGEKRDEKLRAGKQKLAQFQRKKRKKKSHTDETGSSLVSSGELATIIPPQETLSDTGFAFDSDTLATSSCSEDDTDSAQEWSGRAQLHLKSKLQEKSQRVEELEESLVGKQLALDKVIQENEKLKTLISHVQHTEVSDTNHNAVGNVIESQNQSSPVNGTTVNQSAEAGSHTDTEANGASSQEFSISDVQELLHHVQWLQLQLKQANTTLKTQNEKQRETAGALHKAKEDIVILQDGITQKDKLLNELVEKMKQISAEYESLKQDYAQQAEIRNNTLMEELENQCRSVEEMNLALKNELEKVSLEKKNEIQELIEKQGDRINQLTDEYEMKIKQLESELQVMRTMNEEQKSDLDRIQNENVGLQSYCDTLTKGLEFLKEEHEKAVSELNELSAGFKVLKSEYDVLVDEKGQSEVQSETLKSEIDSIKADKQKMAEEIYELKNTNEHLEKELQETNESLEKLRLEHQQNFHDNTVLANELAKQKEDNAMYQTQIAEYEGKFGESAEILEENHSLHVQNDELNNKINNQKDVIASLKNELEVLGVENSQMVDQMKDLSADVQKLKTENEDLIGEKEQLLNDVKLLKDNLLLLENENTKYKDNHLALNEEIQDLKQCLADPKTELQVEMPFFTQHDRSKSQFYDTKSETLNRAEPSEVIEEVIVPQEDILETKAMPQVFFTPKIDEDDKKEFHESDKHKLKTSEELDNDNVVMMDRDASFSAKTTNVSQLPYMNRDAKLEELESEIERLNNVIIELQAENISKEIEADAQKHLQSVDSEETGVQNSPNKVSAQTNTEDTAYESYCFEQPDVQNAERLAEMQQELDNATQMLHEKTKECDALKLELQKAEEKLATSGEALLTQSVENLTPSELPKVSETSSVTSLEREVNMHASSSLCLVPNDGVVTLDSSPGPKCIGDSDIYVDKDTFQNTAESPDDGKELVADNAEHFGEESEPRRNYSENTIESLQNELVEANKVIRTLELEAVKWRDACDDMDNKFKDLETSAESCRIREESLKNEVELKDETLSKLIKENENLETSNNELQREMNLLKDSELEKKEQVKNLCYENEKLTWERDEMLKTLNGLEKEMLDMKTAKCDIEFEKTQYEEELNRVKERLEYLESSDNDIIEIKDMLEKVQEERENIFRENEKLQCSLSAQIEENEKLFERVDCLQKENRTCHERLKVLSLQMKEVTAECEGYKLERDKLEKTQTEVTGEKVAQELRFEGEIEGLLEENSTLKTCVQMKDTEIQTLKVENDRLNSFFPNIDEQTENNRLLKTKNAQLDEQVNELTKENENLMSELMETQGKLAEVAEENETLLDKCDEFQKVICDLDDEKLLLIESIDRTKQELNASMKEKDGLIEKYEMQLECLDQENSTLKTQVLSLQLEMDDQETVKVEEQFSDLGYLKSEKEALVKENEEYKNKVNELEQDMIDLVEQVKLYDETVKEKEDVSERLETQIQELVTENVQLKDKCASVEEDLHQLKENETYLKEQMKIYESALNSQGRPGQQEVERLNAQIELERKYKNKFEHDLASAQSNVQQLQTENESLKETNILLQKEVKEAFHNSCEVERQLNKAKTELEKATVENQKINKEKSELLAVLTEMNQANEGFKVEISTMQHHLHAVSENRNHIRNQIEILAAEIEDLQERNISLVTQNREMNVNNKRLVSENQLLSEQNEDLNVENETIRKISEKLSEENELYKERDLSLENGIKENLAKIKEEMNELQRENEILMQANDDLKSELKEKAYYVENSSEHLAENERLLSENTDLKEQNEDLKSKFQSLREKMVKLDDLIERNRAAELDNDALGERLDALHKRIAEIQKEKEALQKMTDDLTNMLHDMQTKYEEVKSEMECTKKKCDKEIEHLQNQLHEMNNDVSELRKMLDYMENEMYSTTEEKNILKENLEEQQNQFAEVVEQKQKLEEILSDKQQKDLKNMQMASQRQRSNTANTSRSEQASQSSEPSTIQENVSESDCSEIAGQNFSEILRDSMDSDFSDIVPSFESALNLFGLASHGESNASSRMVQTNITVQGCENLGFLLDDNGDNDKQNKDVSKMDSETQTEMLDSDAWKKLSFCYLPHIDIQETVFESSADQNDGNQFVSDKETVEKDTDYEVETVDGRQFEVDRQMSLLGVDDVLQINEETVNDEINDINETAEEFYKLTESHDSQTEVQVKPVSCQSSMSVEQRLQNSEVPLEKSVCFETEGQEDMTEMYVGNVSLLSTDSGILSACIATDGKIQPFQYPELENDTESSNEQNDNVKSEIHYREGSEENDKEYLETCVQTDISFDEELEKAVAETKESLKLETEFKLKELEIEIEERVLKKFEFREQKIHTLEDNYERKVKQVEYDMEEKFEQKFRMREVEVIMQADRDKKDHAAEVENAAEMKVEQIKREKDQQFVETLQKVTADFTKRYRRESGDMRRTVSYDDRHTDWVLDIGPDGDTEGEPEDPLQALAVENRKLAAAKDALQQKINSNQQEREEFCKQLLSIMGEQCIMGNDKPAKNQQASSWLDWEMSPELSFGSSVRSKTDLKNLSGSLDMSSFCSNSNCLNLRMKYGELMGKIHQYLRLKSSEVDTQEPESKETDKDKFVEHEEDLSHILFRGSSVDLEHCVRVPETVDEKNTEDHFIQEEDDGRNTIEINSEVIDLLVKDSYDSLTDKYNFEGHFSENEESDDENSDDKETDEVSHWKGSASFTEDRGSFCIEENFHLSKKRHYSSSDLQTDENKMKNQTSQSENMEGHFVLEKFDSQVETFQIPKTDEGVLEQNVDSDGVFEEIESTQVPSLMMEKTHSTSPHLEADKFIDEVCDNKPPGCGGYSISAKTSPHTGEESGDFFEEKIVKPVGLKSDSVANTDTVAKSSSFRRDLENVSRNLDSDLSSVKQEYKKGQQSYENTVFDILNSICPGTVPGRKPGVLVAAEDTFYPAIRELENTVDDYVESQNSSELSLQKLRIELGHKKLELHSLTKENTQLKESLRLKEVDSQKDIDVLVEQITELEKIKEEQESHILQTEQRLNDENPYEEKCRNLEQANKELQDDIAKCKEQISHLELELEGKSEQSNGLEVLRNELEDERNRLKSLKSKYSEIEQSKNELEIKCSDISMRNMKLESDLLKLENSHKSIEKEMFNLNEAKSELIVENDSLKSRIGSNEEMLHRQEELKIQVQELLKDKEGLKEEIEKQAGTLQSEKEKLERALIAQAKMYDDLEKVVKQSDEENNKLKKILELTKKKNETLNETIEIEVCENKSLKEDLEKEISIKMMLEQREKELNSEIIVLKEDKNELLSHSAALKSENEKLKVAAEEALTSANGLKEEKEQLNSIIQETEEMNKVIKSQLQERDSTIIELKMAKQDLVKLVEKLEESAKALQSDVTEMAENVDKLSKDNEILRCHQEKYNVVQQENEALKSDLVKMTERNEENEWALRELSDQMEQLERSNITYGAGQVSSVDRCTEISINETNEIAIQTEKIIENEISVVNTAANTDAILDNQSYEKDICALKEEIGVLKGENTHLKCQLNESSNTESLEKEIESLKLENETLKRSLDFTMEKDDSDTNLQIFEDMKDAIRSMQAEKSSAEQQEKAMSDNRVHENKRLRDEIEDLYAENDELKKRLKNQEENARKENGEILKMYSDLRNEVEVLVISKHDLEIELHALKDLLEHDPYPTIEKTEHDTSKELTLQDLEEMEDLKASIEKLKSDLKERDSYVRKLEEHLLNMDGNIPELTSTPKPSMSRGMPFISKSFLRRGPNLLSGSGRRAYSHDILAIKLDKEPGENTIDRPEFERSLTLDTSLHINDLNNSRNSDGLKHRKISSSQLSDSSKTSSYQGSLSGSERIRSGLKAEEDGHLALELKQFELVAEITKLRRDFRETKSLYAKETALLTEALEKEKLANELRGMSESTLEHSVGSNLSHDVLKLRKEVARLREQNKLLNMDCDRWIERLKEQEQIVADLKKKISQNTSGYGEIEEVFGRQLALLQKQREELIDKLKDRERENSSLSETLGEKGILEETLRKEKDVLTAKLKEKEKVEEELFEKKVLLENQASKQKELEDVVYQKDLNEIELMKQKRILEEELREIESRFRDKEENLDFEKNKLLNELREKRTKVSRSRFSESDDEVSSVCSESQAFSDRNIGRLEVMLEEVEKQHSVAVNVLREQLKVKYSKREKELRKEHAAGLARLKKDSRNQVN